MKRRDRIAKVIFAISGLCALSLVSASCSSLGNKRLAEDGVAQFHMQLDSEQYHSIYSSADPKFRQASAEPDAVALFGAVHRKLGKVRNAELRNFQVGWYVGQGQTVRLLYHTQFSDGVGDESFVWHIDNDRPLLIGYNINSNALITK